MYVLVVDKDPTITSFVSGLIRRWGYEAYESHSGKEALEMVGEKEFDLVLMDVGIQDMNARDLITGIKAASPLAGIVTMTDRNSGELEKAIRTLGIVYYMSKPVNEQSLKEILDHMSLRKRDASR
jgi:DNA-binding response OmpR family regulator